MKYKGFTIKFAGIDANRMYRTEDETTGTYWPTFTAAARYVLTCTRAQERTRLMFANGTKDNHAQGICINHKDGTKHLEEQRRLFHKSSKHEVMAEGPDFITVRYLDYHSAYDNGVRTYYLDPAA